MEVLLTRNKPTTITGAWVRDLPPTSNDKESGMSYGQFLVKRGEVIMKKLLVLLMCLTLLVAAAMPAAAMTRHRRHYHARHYRTGRTYYTYSAPRHRTFWQKHRDKLTVAGGTLGGAMIGGIAGGHKGAAIGALAGAGGSALYTYKLRKRHRRY